MATSSTDVKKTRESSVRYSALHVRRLNGGTPDLWAIKAGALRNRKCEAEKARSPPHHSIFDATTD
jgi:hypothetical protein